MWHLIGHATLAVLYTLTNFCLSNSIQFDFSRVNSISWNTISEWICRGCFVTLGMWGYVQCKSWRILSQTKPLLINAQKSSKRNHLTSGTKVMVVRDVLYEYIELEPLELEFINTVEFQGLRDLRQLGSASYVFPSANHTRFEHSIGVKHLAGKMMESILKRQPELLPFNEHKRMIQLVKLGGLLHDIGHYAGSHCFDEEVAPAINLPNHEERGTQLVEQMVKKYKIALTQKEVKFVQALILGDPNVEPSWVAGVVHNRENEVDCDKWDYLMRDSYYLKLGQPIQVERLILNMRVLPVPIDSSQDEKDEKKKNMDAGLRICYHEKVFLQICDVFQSRYRLFREVYRHRSILGIDEMMGEIMRSLIPVFRVWIAQDIRPTDAAISSIPHWLPMVPTTILPQTEKDKVLEIWTRLRSRRLYKVEKTDSAHADIHVRLGLSSRADDPVEQVWFYNHLLQVSKIKIHDVTKMLGSSPRQASETIHYQLKK